VRALPAAAQRPRQRAALRHQRIERSPDRSRIAARDREPCRRDPRRERLRKPRRQLVRQGAIELAQKAGREKLALLEQGKSDRDAGLTFAKAVPLARNRPQPGFSPDALTKIFQADATKLPRYAGAQNERGGFSIYKLVNVVNPPEPETAKLTSARKGIAEAQSREVFDAYVTALKDKAKVEINQTNLDKK